MENEDDGRLSFAAAVDYVRQQPGAAAFAAIPVFGERSDDEEQRAEGVRLFILEADQATGYRIRFLAGPFFSTAYGANEIFLPDDVPERLKELRFLPTQLDEAWLDEQIQVLVQKLTQASGVLAQMPDYQQAVKVNEAAVPIKFVSRKQ
jgi:hypothetical protein